MIIIGVTGGIGAGKSSISAILETLGARVLDADLISKQVVAPNTKAWLEIRKAFGKEVFKRDGTLDRKKLAIIVFTSEKKKRLLESIIHKEVVAIIRENIDTMREGGYKGTVVLDVPIPVEEGFLDTVDRVWVVVSDNEIRLNRIMIRGGISREDAENRIKSQHSQDEYKELAHDVIENNGSIEELRYKVEELYNNISKNNVNYM